jgi:cobalt-zinc-cadmium efflux system membrane fusion protein
MEVLMLGSRSPGRLALALSTALIIAGCSSKSDEADSGNVSVSNVQLTKAQRSHVQIYSVVPISYRQRIQAPGTVDFDNDQSTAVVSPFTGPVTRTLVELGQHVEKGQPLALVQSGDYAAAIGAYRKAVATARNAEKLAQADRDLAAHNGISAREAAQAQTDAAGANADRDAALQTLVSLNVDRGTIAAVQSGRVAAAPAAIIRAPVAGIVVDKQITPGQLLQAGTSQTFTVANLSRVWVLAQLSTSDLAKVALHDVADIDPGNGTGKFHGSVDNISAAVDPNTRAVTARIVAPNPNGLLKKQMYVGVSIQSGHLSTGLLVPVSAILRDDENLPFVYVAQPDGSFARRHVTLGYRDSQQYEVTNGLASGDRIVADGALFLQFMQSQ